MKYDLSRRAIVRRVRQGAKRYDEMKPDWWTTENVDLDILDESNPRRSVAGQNRNQEKTLAPQRGKCDVWGGSWIYCEFGFITNQQAAAEGFYFTIDKDGFSAAEWDTVRENELLTEAWRSEVLVRRKRIR